MTPPVAVCAPLGRDGTIILEILRGGGIACEPTTPAELVKGFSRTYAAAVLTEEAVTLLKEEQWREALALQPPWSDFPFLVLTSKGPRKETLANLLAGLGNVIQVSRPLRPADLRNFVRNALRARARQIEAGSYLERSAAAEAELKLLANNLESQVAKRTSELTEANLELAQQIETVAETQQRLNELQTELVHVARISAMGTMASTLAHELNQPLTSVVNYLQGCVRLVDRTQSNTQLVNGIEEALASALRAGEIIRRLRDLVSRGVVNRQPEGLEKLIEGALALGLVDAQFRQITCHVELDPNAVAIVDRVQIQQVLINLLRNSVEAMMSVERREIRIHAAQVSKQSVEVSVADTGPGLPPEVLSSLFSSFQTTKEGGMGMGLSICRTIIEAHGGTITGENLHLKGAVFRITLPSPPRVDRSRDWGA